MREIKFRGLMANGGWAYGSLKPDLPGSTAYYSTFSQRICWFPVSGGESNIPVLNGTVGQYTGLKDKNGREIFEGVILETSNSDDPCYEIVEWGTQEWQPNNIPLCDTLIVGNIHEGEYKKEAAE
jgi:hypothetical protein